MLAWLDLMRVLEIAVRLEVKSRRLQGRTKSHMRALVSLNEKELSKRVEKTDRSGYS